MKRYVFQRYYHSDFGTYQKGEVIELDDDTAAWLNRDSHGVIVAAEALAARAVEAAPADRMVKKAAKRKRT